MKRTLAVLAMVGAVMAAMALPASAKGEGPVGATITGPGIGGPGGGGSGGGSGGGTSVRNTGGGAAMGTIELSNKSGLEPFRNNPLWRLASFSGLVTSCSTCTSYIDTSAPRDVGSLGPAYRIRYFAGTCCDNSVRQVLYPFAPGGPVAFTTDDVGKGFFLVSHRTGWWHADGRMGQLFLRFLHHVGVPKDNPAVASGGGAGAAAASAAGAAAWRVPLALAVLAMLLIGGAALARPRSPARPA